MQLTILNSNPNPYLAGQIVNDYSSLIWTERFRDYGEFQLIMPKSSPNAKEFWPGRLLGIKESNCVMLAETQQEKINEAGYREVTVTGRSADSIMEDRVLWAPQGSTSTLTRQYSYLDACLLYIWQAVANDSISDVAYSVDRPAEISDTNAIPNAIVTDSTIATQLTQHKIRVDLGQIGPQVRQGLNAAGCSVRCIRPPSDVSKAMKVTVDTANGANKGQITRSIPSATDAATMLRFDVYQGTDRVKAGPEMVYLSVESGQLENANVATSYKEFVTRAVHGVDSTHYYGSQTPLATDQLISPFIHRHRFVDASGSTQGAPVGDYPEIVDRLEAAFYRDHVNKAFLDADMTDGSQFTFGTHYFLGDTIMLKYFDRTRRVLVNEFTRVDDLEGIRSYPTFLAWDAIDGQLVRDW